MSKALRRLVAAQAKQRCGYCLSPQRITGTPMEIEHLVPESAGGLTTEANLWLASSIPTLARSAAHAGVVPGGAGDA